MKKLLLVCAMAAFGIGQSWAQLDTEDYGIFNRFGLGIGFGTTGITLDASTNITHYVGIRAGIDFMPKIKVDTDLDLKVETGDVSMSQVKGYANQLNQYLPADQQIDLSDFPDGEMPNKMDVQGKLNNTTGHILVDVYPFPKKSSFRVTLGAYFGPSKIVKVYNKEDGFLQPVNQWNYAVENANVNTQPIISQYNLKMIGAELGDYFITPNPADKGNVEANVKVNGFRPYVGLGFGRAIPKKRIGCQFDLGVQFWGTPKVYAPLYDKTTKQYGQGQLEKSKVEGDGGDVIKTISKISVYPVLSFRLVGRIL